MIKFVNFSKKYDNNVVFNSLNLSIPKGKTTIILGGSGIGKTTILNALANLITYEGEILDKPNKISYIFQEPRLINNLTVKENLKLVNKNLSDEMISKTLNKLELENKANSYPSNLSGGERQRVAIARAFLVDFDLLLLDEPFSFLDIVLKAKLRKNLKGLLKENKKTSVFVTHDLEDVFELADLVLVISKNNQVHSIVLDENDKSSIEKMSKIREDIYSKLSV